MKPHQVAKWQTVMARIDRVENSARFLKSTAKYVPNDWRDYLFIWVAAILVPFVRWLDRKVMR